jgi:hypothetical protein
MQMDESELLAQHLALTRLSRGQLLRGGAVTLGSLAGAGMFSRSAFGASGADPRPIPGGFDENFDLVPANPLVHVLPPVQGLEMSTITDFNGVVAAAEIQGTANNGAFNFDADMRFMQGLYVGTDGRLRQGSFGFV